MRSTLPESQLPGIPDDGTASYRDAMVTLHIEHSITDFATWAEAFGRFADVRRDAGVRAERVQHRLDDPCHLHIDLDFDTVESAAAFREFLHSVIWATPDDSPALVGAPTTTLLETAPL